MSWHAQITSIPWRLKQKTDLQILLVRLKRQGARKQRQNRSRTLSAALANGHYYILTDLIVGQRSIDEKRDKKKKSVSLTSCSVSVDGSETWGLGPGRRGRPAAECGWCGPGSETRADEPEESPPRTWRRRGDKEQRVRSHINLRHSQSFALTFIKRVSISVTSSFIEASNSEPCDRKK